MLLPTSWNYEPQSPTRRPLLQVCSPLLAGRAKSWDWKSRRSHLHHSVSVWWGIGNHSSTVCTNKSSGATSFLAQLKHIFGSQTTAWKTGGVLPPLYKKCFSPQRTKCKEVGVLCLKYSKFEYPAKTGEDAWAEWEMECIPRQYQSPKSPAGKSNTSKSSQVLFKIS